jgi:hypothetical protein
MSQPQPMTTLRQTQLLHNGCSGLRYDIDV